jgi:ABC-type Na+ transport system ATPase subunit NatA
MYEVSTLDHLSAKVDALFQKFDKLTVSAVTPAPVSPHCEVCGIFGQTGAGVTTLTVNLSNFWKSASTLADR